MNNAQLLSRLSNSQLAQYCADETKKYYRHQVNNPEFCFELFRRSCVDHDNEALNFVHQQYFQMLVRVAYHHEAFAQSSQDAFALATTAFTKFYQAVKGSKFLQKFSMLREVLEYLKLCVHNEILQDIRQNKRNTKLDDDFPAPPDRYEVSRAEIWARIRIVLPDFEDQKLAHLRFVLEMKPAEITRRHPELGTSVEISQKLSLIRQKLRNDPVLRGFIGLGSV